VYALHTAAARFQRAKPLGAQLSATVAETGPTYGGLTPRDAGDMISRSLYWAFAVGHHGV